jgi:hypothetical protein
MHQRQARRQPAKRDTCCWTYLPRTVIQLKKRAACASGMYVHIFVKGGGASGGMGCSAPPPRNNPSKVAQQLLEQHNLLCATTYLRTCCMHHWRACGHTSAALPKPPLEQPPTDVFPNGEQGRLVAGGGLLARK